MAVQMWIVVFWVVMLCNIIGGYQCFEQMLSPTSFGFTCCTVLK